MWYNIYLWYLVFKLIIIIVIWYLAGIWRIRFENVYECVLMLMRKTILLFKNAFDAYEEKIIRRYTLVQKLVVNGFDQFA